MTKERILVVDDDRSTGRILTTQLEEMGYDVVAHARSGLEAIHKSETLEPDLILMDIRLGRGIDGIEAAETIQHHQGKPVIFVTAHADDATLQRAKRTRPYGYINKPIRPSDLRATIVLALERVRELKESRREEMEAAADIWRLQLEFDATGKLLSDPDTVRATLDRIGGNDWETLLPPDHKQNIAHCLSQRRTQLVTVRVGERILSWEYQPIERRRAALITVMDVTAHTSLVARNIQEAALSEALDRLSTGVLLTNENLKLFHANKSARRILGTSDQLWNREGHLQCRTPGLTAVLQRKVLETRSSTLTLERPGNQPPLHLLISPLNAHSENYGRNLPTAMIHVFEAITDGERIEEVLRSLYALSRTEARVAARLVLNPQVHEVAENMGITYNTARTHLKHIYAKIGVNRLSSLVHIVVTGPVGLLIRSTD